MSDRTSATLNSFKDALNGFNPPCPKCGYATMLLARKQIHFCLSMECNWCARLGASSGLKEGSEE
jgi:hypothetical protein